MTTAQAKANISADVCPSKSAIQAQFASAYVVPKGDGQWWVRVTGITWQGISWAFEDNPVGKFRTDKDAIKQAKKDIQTLKLLEVDGNFETNVSCIYNHAAPIYETSIAWSNRDFDSTRK